MNKKVKLIMVPILTVILLTTLLAGVMRANSANCSDPDCGSSTPQAAIYCGTKVFFSVEKNSGGSLSAEAKDEGGTLTSGQLVERRNHVDFTAKPNKGYQVKAWKIDGKVVPGNTTNNYTLTCRAEGTKEVTVTVEFELISGKVPLVPISGV